MIDHVLGRPSVKSRRLQVLAVLLLWSAVLFRGHRHGPPGTRSLSRILTKKLTAWQTVLSTLIYVYAARNFSTLVGFAAPEPLGGMYDAAYFRATWVMTALDAGFWSAMRIRTPWLRDIAGMAFSVFYLFAAERADERVRKVRGMLTVEHLRVSWNKGVTPYLGFLQRLLRPRLTRWPPRAIRIPRPAGSDYREPVAAWLYYDGPVAELRQHGRIVLDVPGGGFVSMDPRCHDDRLLAWATKTRLPVLSLDYRKAPEHPYPYALNECVDVYTTIVNTRGKCLGLAGNCVPRIAVTGDSAGGNLAVAMTLMIIERNLNFSRRSVSSPALPLPDGLLLCYPSLDMNIGNWMTDEQMSLIRDRRMRRTNRSIVRRKSMQYASLVGTPHHSDDEDESPQKSVGDPMAAPTKFKLVRPVTAPPTLTPNFPLAPQPEYSHGGPTALSPAERRQPQFGIGVGVDVGVDVDADADADDDADANAAITSTSHHPEPLRTRLATSSMISYFNDRVLTPEMMRAMIILYIGPHNRPDFSREYLLSPVLAPDSLLELFPKTYFLTGERDPLVDDTVIFAGRLRRCKEALFHRTYPARAAAESPAATTPVSGGCVEDPFPSDPVFNDKDAAEVTLIPGISHGFMQVPSLYPPAWKYFDRCAAWIDDIFTHAEWVRERDARERRRSERAVAAAAAAADGRHHARTESSGDEGLFLEIGMTRLQKGKGKGVAGDEGEDGGGDGEAERQQPTEDGPAMRGRGAGNRRRGAGRKDRSLVRLGSTEDLLRRRMQGLAGGLTGLGEDR